MAALSGWAECYPVGRQSNFGNKRLQLALRTSGGTIFQQHRYNTLARGDNTWFLASWTWDGTDVVAYQDGAVYPASSTQADDVGTMTDAADRGVALATFILSTECSGDYHSYGIWDKVLTAPEMLALFNAGNGAAFDWEMTEVIMSLVLILCTGGD